eukprot:TRINITY_DN22840_c0_g1_i1.p1 TRINITY_DN22840_c0_g1~~TRINITY_DN22840_c0_g1_i1.p1  ORF type:complete len:471 (+),score=101.84 TRINITY_DN22840_c0_g1_i1:173-1585(+)
MLSAPLCKCICGSTRKGDPLDHHLDSLGEVEEAFQQHYPSNSGLLSYYDAADQPMRGVPIREGKLWLLSAEEEVEAVTLSLYVNGFAFSHHGREVSVSFSPFGLVRNCKFQSSSLGGTELAAFKCFKVSLYTQGICFYFGVRGEDDTESENERSRWVLDVSRAMRLVTQSLFPVHVIACDPIKSAQSTHRRLMAGYLVHHDGGAVASVLYCELHPQNSLGTAKLVLYEDEFCQSLVVELLITDRSCCCEKVGINCSCFSIEDHQFSSRTLSERRLWLRAISNLKVKLQNRAPSPSDEELRHYRLAIQEHLKSSDCGAAQSQAPMDALLQRFTPRGCNGTIAGSIQSMGQGFVSAAAATAPAPPPVEAPATPGPDAPAGDQKSPAFSVPPETPTPDHPRPTALSPSDVTRAPFVGISSAMAVSPTVEAMRESTCTTAASADELPIKASASALSSPVQAKPRAEEADVASGI